MPVSSYHIGSHTIATWPFTSDVVFDHLSEYYTSVFLIIKATIFLFIINKHFWGDTWGQCVSLLTTSTLLPPDFVKVVDTPTSIPFEESNLSRTYFFCQWLFWNRLWLTFVQWDRRGSMCVNLRIKLLSYKLCACSTLIDTTKYFSKGVISVYSFTEKVCVTVLHVLANTR